MGDGWVTVGDIAGCRMWPGFAGVGELLPAGALQGWGGTHGCRMAGSHLAPGLTLSHTWPWFPCVPGTGLGGGRWSRASPCGTRIWQNRLGSGRATHGAGRALGQGSHPGLSLLRHGRGYTSPGITTFMVAQPHVPQHCHPNYGTATAIRPPASPRSWWHPHGHVSLSITAPMVAWPWPYVPQHHHPHGGTSMATCPSASPHPWWHGHGHVSPSITAPVVAWPWPRVPQHHHPHGGTSMATCPSASPHPWWHGRGHMSPGITTLMVAPPWPRVPQHHRTHGGTMARPYVPWHHHPNHTMAMALRALVLPHPWWHGHSHMSPGTATLPMGD